MRWRLSIVLRVETLNRGAAPAAARPRQRPADAFGLETAHLFAEVHARLRRERIALRDRIDLVEEREHQITQPIESDSRVRPGRRGWHPLAIFHGRIIVVPRAHT